MAKKLAIKSFGSGSLIKNSEIKMTFLAVLSKNKILNTSLLKIITHSNILIFKHLRHIQTFKC
mgnify:CR=1 FL=1|jgi:hypothetical protein